MSRLLFWLALAWLIVAAIRTKLRAVHHQPNARTGVPPPPPQSAPEAMACCAHCHVYFPSSEAVRADGSDYCCPAHVRLPPR